MPRDPSTTRPRSITTTSASGITRARGYGAAQPRGRQRSPAARAMRARAGMRPTVSSLASLALALPAAACMDTAGPEPGYYHGHAVIDLGGVETDTTWSAALLEV